MLRFASSMLMIFLLSAPVVYAQDSQFANNLDEDKEAKTAALFNFPKLISEKWNRVTEAISAGDLRQVSEDLDNLDRFKIEVGLEGLEDYSSFLIAKGHEALNRRDFETALFYSKKAILLSPTSAKTLFRTLRFARLSSDVPSHLLRAIKYAFSTPTIVLNFVIHLVYPALWALTLAIYVIFVFTIATNGKNLVKEVALGIPVHLRGILAPLLAVVFLVMPILFNPIWCIFCWSLIFLTYLPRFRWLSFYAGIIIFTWTAVIPLRETIGVWLSDRAVQTMLNVSSGYFTAIDRSDLSRLVEIRPSDGVVHYIYGQLLRKLGDYKGSSESFLKAEVLLGEQPWTKAQRGIIAFLSGDAKKADELMAEAEKLGLNSTEFYFDYSKVKFELLDTTQSREYLKRANRKNADLTAVLQGRENQLGLGSNQAIAEIRLPLHVVIASSIQPVLGGFAKFNEAAHRVFFGLDLVWGAVAGCILVALFFLSGHEQRRKRVTSFYRGYETNRVIQFVCRCIPGGSWVLGGRPSVGLFILAIVLFMAMPLLRWPSEMSQILFLSGEALRYYLMGFIAMLSILLGSGLFIEREE